MSTTSSTTTMKPRKPKWHPTPPPPPSPKILNLPRRTRRRQPKNPTRKQPASSRSSNHQHYYYYNSKGKLESLFEQEREFSRSDNVPVVLINSSSSTSQRRERVEDNEEIVVEECGESGGGTGIVAEEKWKFQAEILRAECKFLRMEREIALKKLERNRKQMERALRSAVHTLLSGREKMSDGKNVSAVLKGEIKNLAESLKKLENSSKFKDVRLPNCNNFNFDKDVSRLQEQLKNPGVLSHEKRINKEMQQIAESTAESSVASSASNSKRIECSDLSSSSSRNLFQEGTPLSENKCSGRCKAVVRRIVEQVRTETEQWSQMQEMLGQVRGEMEELQASRDFWEDRALNSDRENQVLKSSVEDWKEKALNSEVKVNQLQTELSELKAKEQKEKEVTPLHRLPLISLGNHLEKENSRYEMEDMNKKPPLSLGKQLAKEKRLLLHRLKGNQEFLSDGRREVEACSNGVMVPKRLPFRDIGNSTSPLTKLNATKAVFPLQSPKPYKTVESLVLNHNEQ